MDLTKVVLTIEYPLWAVIAIPTLGLLIVVIQALWEKYKH